MTDLQLRDENSSNQVQRSWASAPVDVFEGDNEYLLVADMPGVTKESLSLRYEDGQLALEGNRQLSPERSLVYKRTFEVSSDVDPAGITAELKHGVLSVRLPKREEHRPRSIPIAVQ